EMEVWQLRQVIYALRILFLEMTRLDWPATYDWSGRLAACEELAPTHPCLPHSRRACSCAPESAIPAYTAPGTKRLGGGAGGPRRPRFPNGRKVSFVNRFGPTIRRNSVTAMMDTRCRRPEGVGRADFSAHPSPAPHHFAGTTSHAFR
ncbi:hypothetical protein, partial [Pontiella sp.]|uniref:hypothetical protein n=1 Tax=Pontiella sp. TaxID=2837462 RepID=UPI003561443F